MVNSEDGPKSDPPVQAGFLTHEFTCKAAAFPGDSQWLILTRISHHFPTTSLYIGSPQAFPRSRVLDILSSMPVRPFGRKRLWKTNLQAFVTKTGEKCGLKFRIWCHYPAVTPAAADFEYSKDWLVTDSHRLSSYPVQRIPLEFGTM